MSVTGTDADAIRAASGMLSTLSIIVVVKSPGVRSEQMTRNDRPERYKDIVCVGVHANILRRIPNAFCQDVSSMTCGSVCRSINRVV